ncbi:MAG: hypothetical protein ACO3ZW_03060, partial [Opitutales bacterium]
LKTLEVLLDEDDPNERLMRAEVCRESGKFDEAKRLLSFVFPDDYQTAVKIISGLCEEQNIQVARLNLDGD